MNVIRWQRPVLANWPNLDRLTGLRAELDRFFETPLAELARNSQVFSGWSPALDLYEDSDKFTVHVELPGMNKEDIDISLHGGSLSISGERKVEEKHESSEAYRSERYVGRFQRSVHLPAPVAGDRVTAQYKDGVLTVTLPKAEEAKAKQISVQEG
ncbi:MAG TPA: Hsp20/alpha crystallin family protein [Verrucomicrobiae bacterium]|nr:Hsp20/alpha crystallin family protein [Verrucomicrobiae bacterium]